MPESDNKPLHELLGRTPECLPIETLAAIESSSSPESPARRHLEHCSYCRHELGTLRAFEAAAASDSESPEVAWIVGELRRRPIARGSAADQPSRVDQPPSIWERLTGWVPEGMPKWIPAGAAAAVLFMIGSGLYLADRGRPAASGDARGEFVWRSAAVQLISPAGDVYGPPRAFEWSPAAGARFYRIRLLEVDRTEIWSEETSATRIDIPPPVAAQLTPGRTFLWQVVAHGASGVISQSNLQTFHISLKTR